MPRTENEIRVTPSVLDRLLDDEPEVLTEEPLSRAQSLRQMKKSVRRHLKSLLNTRDNLNSIYRAEQTEKADDQKSEDGDAEVAREPQDSLLCYGLPDFSSASILSEKEQNRIRLTLKKVIEKFEPRLL